jgi:hypothetical protein
VFQAVREFMETGEPQAVVFTADDEDLASEWATLLRLI